MEEEKIKETYLEIERRKPIEPVETIEPKPIEKPVETPIEDPISPQVKREKIKEVNEDPETKKYGAVVLSKKTYYIILTFATIITLLFITNVFWSNMNVSSGKMRDNLTITNNVNVPGNPTYVNLSNKLNNDNDFIINNKNNVTVYIDLDEAIIQELTDEIIEIINNQTNSS